MKGRSVSGPKRRDPSVPTHIAQRDASHLRIDIDSLEGERFSQIVRSDGRAIASNVKVAIATQRFATISGSAKWERDIDVHHESVVVVVLEETVLRLLNGRNLSEYALTRSQGIQGAMRQLT